MNLFRRFVFSIWYYFRPPWDTGVSPPELMEFLDTHSPGRGLDLGCGTGTNVLELARRGWQVSGVDFAPSAIRIARRKARSEGVAADLRVGDVSRLDHLEDKFNLVLDIGCLHGLNEADKIKTMENVRDLLDPTGTYLLYAMLRDSGVDTGPGLTSDDLRRLGLYFSLRRREDGLNRGTRPSVWLTYRLRSV